jgi:hypothetical protein
MFGKALSPAEKQRRYRERKAQKLFGNKDAVTKPDGRQSFGNKDAVTKRIAELETEVATLRSENTRLRRAAPAERPTGKHLANTGRDSGQLGARIRELEAQLARALKAHAGIYTAEEYRKIRAAVQPRPHDGPKLQKISEEATKLITLNEKLLCNKKEPVKQPSTNIDFSQVEPIVTRYTEGKTKVNIEKVLQAIFAEVPELQGKLGVLGAQYVQRCLIRRGFKPRGQKTWERQ